MSRGLTRLVIMPKYVLQRWSCFQFSKLAPFCSKSEDAPPRNVMENLISAHHQVGTGKVYDKKPFKISLEAGKKYVWCLCGHSHTQPFCDGTHRNQQLRITLKPVHFKVEESRDYWLCNCKQTENRPFCDGTHKLQRIQEGSSTVRS